MIRYFIIILFLLSVYTGALAAENIAIQAGKIFTISGNVIENGVILIESGKIKAVGSDVNIPADARIIDAKDKIAMPGIIDAGSRLYVLEGELNESRPVAPELNILDALDPFIKEYQEVLAQGVTAVCIAPGSRSLIGGRSALLKLKGRKLSEMLLKSDASIKASIGVSSNNQSSSLARLENYSSIREAFIETQAYLQQKRKYDQDLAEYKKKKADEKQKKEELKRPVKPRPNPAYEMLAKVLNKEIPFQIEAHRVDDIMNALRLADEFGFSLILDKCTEGYKIPGEIARRKIPVIVGPVSTSFVDMPKLEYRNHDTHNAGDLSKCGIKVALGVSGRDGASSKFIASAAAIAAANGMDKNLALRAITLTPAEIFGVADRIGSLDVGKDANIVILSGEPLSTSSRVEMVLIEGETVYQRKAAQ